MTLFYLNETGAKLFGVCRPTFAWLNQTSGGSHKTDRLSEGNSKKSISTFFVTRLPQKCIWTAGRNLPLCVYVSVLPVIGNKDKTEARLPPGRVATAFALIDFK